MSFEKKIGNNNEKITVASKAVFAKGVKYFFNDKKWIIVESFKDCGTEFRRSVGDDGTQEVLTLETLKKDSLAPNFKFIEGD
jgi:hypothetical protein